MEIVKTKGMIKAIDQIVVKKLILCVSESDSVGPIKQNSRLILRSVQLFQNSKAFVEEI
jgi:hypothetical protein